MKRFIVSIGIVLAVLIAALAAFGQDANRANQAQQQNVQQKFQNMTPEQREKLKEEMRQRR
jgi:hypothetical protein